MALPNPNNGRIIVLMNPLYPLGYDLLQYIISNQKLTAPIIDCYMYKETDDFAALVRNLYFNGYRFFIGPQNSATLESLTTFFTNRQDALYINSSSTVYNLSMPPNMIRSSVNDYALCEYINNYFLLHAPELLEISQNDKMYEPLSDTPVGTVAFKRIVYIYQESNYTREFLNMLEQTKDPSLNIPIIPYLIKDTDLSFSEELGLLLKENPVSGPDYKQSEKTLFIVNSSTPQDMLYFFNELAYSDNYFYFCDPFFADQLETIYQFHYSFFGAGNYSTVGYKLSQQVDPNQDISPVALGIVDLILQLGQWYMNNQKGSTMQQLIDKLKNIDYLYIGNDDNWYWYVRQIYIYNAKYPTISDAPGDYKLFKDPLIFKSTASPSQNGGVSSQELLGTTNYVFNPSLNDTYERNVKIRTRHNWYDWGRPTLWECTTTTNQPEAANNLPKTAWVKLADEYTGDIAGYKFPLANNALIIAGGDVVQNYGGNASPDNLNLLFWKKYTDQQKNWAVGKKFLLSFDGCPRAQGRKDTTISINLVAVYAAGSIILLNIINNYKIPSPTPSSWYNCKLYFTMPFVPLSYNGYDFRRLKLAFIGDAKDKSWVSAITNVSIREVLSG